MSHTVTRSQVGARSKLCTLFFTLRAILQSPQPKSATTKDDGLQIKITTVTNIAIYQQTTCELNTIKEYYNLL